MNDREKPATQGYVDDNVSHTLTLVMVVVIAMVFAMLRLSCQLQDRVRVLEQGPPLQSNDWGHTQEIEP